MSVNFDSDGVLPSGLVLTVNVGPRPEPVLTRAQWAAIREQLVELSRVAE